MSDTKPCKLVTQSQATARRVDDYRLGNVSEGNVKRFAVKSKPNYRNWIKGVHPNKKPGQSDWPGYLRRSGRAV
jgi:hypothetical protein